jgi:hypothetical protein
MFTSGVPIPPYTPAAAEVTRQNRVDSKINPLHIFFIFVLQLYNCIAVQVAGMLAVMAIMAVMTFPASVIFMLSLFLLIMFVVLSLFHIYPTISLHIVRTTSVTLNVHVRRCRLVVTDAETRVGSTYLRRKCGPGFIEAE